MEATVRRFSHDLIVLYYFLLSRVGYWGAICPHPVLCDGRALCRYNLKKEKKSLSHYRKR